MTTEPQRSDLAKPWIEAFEIERSTGNLTSQGPVNTKEVIGYGKLLPDTISGMFSGAGIYDIMIINVVVD